MSRRLKKRSEKSGLPPGSLVRLGEKKSDTTTLRVIRYSKDKIEELSSASVEEALSSQDPDMISWINIDGIDDVATIEKIGSHFGIHPLVLEDLLNTSIRPKHEDFGGYFVTILKMLIPRPPGKGPDSESPFTIEQVTLILGPKWILSFQERANGDVFDKVRERLRAGRVRIRSLGPAYLFYALVDAIVDGYFLVLENLGEDIEKLEDKVTDNPEAVELPDIHSLRHHALELRRAIWPVRDIMSALSRDDCDLIPDEIEIYFRDIYDHSVETIDILEAYREMVSGLMELYLSSISNRLNSVMMVLTVATVIFMPLTFIVGLYGMNFKYMPELEWKYSYPVVILLMLLIAGVMVYIFKRKKWI